jgi:hypothetical protein
MALSFFSLKEWDFNAPNYLQEFPTPKMAVVADKGFNFSSVDDSFIVQKKNHFQVYPSFRSSKSGREQANQVNTLLTLSTNNEADDYFSAKNALQGIT